MKKLLVGLTLFGLLSSAAMANDRIIIYPATNPSSTQSNLNGRLQRLSNGTFIRDALGPTAIAGGVYTNLSVVPNGGNNLAVTPTNTTIGPGVLYQLGKLDPNPLPQSQSSTNQLSADTTPIAVNALQSVSVGGLGPITAPAAGSSVYVLVEGQVQTNDTTPLLFNTLTNTGGQSSEIVPSLRQDQYVYQLKYGVNAGAPTQPTVDTGWIPVAYVLVPSGTTTITQGMITPAPPFLGFAQNGLAGSFSSLKINNTTAGCLQSDSNGNVHSLACTSGLGTVVGTSPITASTQNNIATIGLGHGDYDDILNAQTITGAKTFSQSVAVGGGTGASSVTISNNPSSTASATPKLYLSQNVAGGGKYGFDSSANQLRLLNTPYSSSGGSTEAVLGYFDSAGSYHVGSSTFGYNTTIGNTLTAGQSSLGQTSVTGPLQVTNGSTLLNDIRTYRANSTATGALFFGQSSSNYLYFDGNTFNFTGPIAATTGAFTGSVTAQGALAVGPAYGSLVAGDISAARSATTGAIFYGSNGAHYTFFDGTNYNMPSGGLVLGGGLSASGIYNSIGTSAGNGVLQVPGTGQLLLNWTTGGTVQIGNGAGGPSGISFNHDGTANFGSLTTAGSAVIGTAVQIGPNSPSSGNYIVHGQTGTYPYLDGVYNGGNSGSAHIQGGIFSDAVPNGHYGVTFSTPFQNQPFCTTGIGSYAGSTPTSGYIVITQYYSSGSTFTGVVFQNQTNVPINLNWQCSGS